MKLSAMLAPNSSSEDNADQWSASRVAAARQASHTGRQRQDICVAEMLVHGFLRVVEHRDTPVSILLGHDGDRDKLWLFRRLPGGPRNSSIEVDDCNVRPKEAQIANMESQFGVSVAGVEDLLMHVGDGLRSA